MTEVTRTIVLPSGDRELTMRAFTLSARGPGVRASERYTQRRVVIGSSGDADLVVDDSLVSRKHCAIEVDASGYRVVDLDSKNGTWVGEVRVRDAFVEPGDQIRIGETTVDFDVSGDEIQVRFSGRNRFGRLIGQSESMREIFAVLERISPTDLTVLVEGPSGTGKELIAEGVHQASKRRAGPFVVFDCSAVSADLIESELFGHVKGAFTGAVAPRKGAFEEATGGTLFIDELGELSPELQPKLLRALERREIRRVGSNEVVPVDVRIICATNRDLNDLVRRGQFREDLYYRVSVIHLRVPPLHERPDDIPLLVEHFLDEVRRRTGQASLNIAWSTMDRLKKHPWPGNVRELRNFIDRAAALAGADQSVETRYLQLREPPARDVPASDGDWMARLGIDPDMPFKEAKELLIERFERGYWTRLLQQSNGNISQAARIAGLHRKSLEYILRKLDIDRLEMGGDRE
jgi:transcriptional regulator with GAF, ATPase, and Fis domain